MAGPTWFQKLHYLFLTSLSPLWRGREVPCPYQGAFGYIPRPQLAGAACACRSRTTCHSESIKPGNKKKSPAEVSDPQNDAGDGASTCAVGLCTISLLSHGSLFSSVAFACRVPPQSTLSNKNKVKKCARASSFLLAALLKIDQSHTAT